MVWTAAFVLVLLAFDADASSICADDGAPCGACYCHPERLEAYIECKNGKDVVSTCPDGLSWSLKLKACVNRMLSECAGLVEQKTKKKPAQYCDSQPSSGSNDIISFRCHPKDAALFVICPPNTIIANIARCPAGRRFSLADKKCVDSLTTDCGLELEAPEAGSLVVNPEDITIDSKSSVPQAGNLSNCHGNNVGNLKANTTKSTVDIAEPELVSTSESFVSANLVSNDTGAESSKKESPNSTDSNSDDGDGGPAVGEIRFCPDGGVPPCAPTRLAPYPFGPYPPVRGVPKKPTAVCRSRYSYHPERADWEGARQICEMEGGQLAVISSERAQGRIGSRFGKLAEFWIGATDIEREGQFRWVNGQGLGFARWYSSQPSKKYPNNEHCVTFNYWGKDTKWGDRNCFDSRPFLCETMVCRPSVRRFPGGYPGQFRGPLRNPYQFPRNQNFPGPRGMGGVATDNWPRGRGFPYDQFQRVRTPINL